MSDWDPSEEDETESLVNKIIADLYDKENSVFCIPAFISLYEIKDRLAFHFRKVYHVRTIDIGPRQDGYSSTKSLRKILQKFFTSKVQTCHLRLRGIEVYMPSIWKILGNSLSSELEYLTILHEEVFGYDLREFELLKRFPKLRSLEIGNIRAGDLFCLLENLPEQVDNLVVHVYPSYDTNGTSYDRIVSLVLEHLPRFKTFKLSFVGEISNSELHNLEKEHLKALYEKYATQAETNNLTSACTIQGFEDENLLGYVRLNHAVDSFKDEAKRLKLDGELSLALDRDYEDEAPSPKKRKCNLQEVHPMDKKFEAIRGYATRKVALKQVYDASVKLMGQDKADSILNSF